MSQPSLLKGSIFCNLFLVLLALEETTTLLSKIKRDSCLNTGFDNECIFRFILQKIHQNFKKSYFLHNWGHPNRIYKNPSVEKWWMVPTKMANYKKKICKNVFNKEQVAALKFCYLAPLETFMNSIENFKIAKTYLYNKPTINLLILNPFYSCVFVGKTQK